MAPSRRRHPIRRRVHNRYSQSNDNTTNKELSTTTVPDLPVEILSEIASWLPYTDILAIRQVNKSFRDATNSRIVYLGVATQVATDLCKQPELGTKSLNSLSTSELRKWLAKRIRIDDLWRKSEEYDVRPRSRILDAVFEDILVTRLLPGGRWLLTGHSSGRVCYYDLEKEEPVPIHLLPDPEKKNTGGDEDVRYIDFDVEPGYAPSEFTIALKAGSDRYTYPFIRIWKVRIEEDGTLKATWLTSVSSYRGDFLSLNAHIVASAFWFNDYYWITAYWWKECTSSHQIKCIFPVTRGVKLVSVIGDDRLLCISSTNNIYLFELEPQIVEEDRKDQLLRNASWSSSLHYDGGTSFSRLYFDGNNYYQVISTKRRVLGIRIPASKEENATLIELANFSRLETGCGLGLHKGLAYFPMGESRFGYLWTSEPQEAYKNRGSTTWEEPHTRPPHTNYLDFDDELGVLAFMGELGSVVVVDFPV